MSDDSGFCGGGWNPICWPVYVALAPFTLLSGCSSEGGGSNANFDAGVGPNNDGTYGNSGQGEYNPNSCKLPAKKTDEPQAYYKDVFITDEAATGNQCKSVQKAMEIADKTGATVHFIPGDHHKESFTVNALFKKLAFVTDLKPSANLSSEEAAKNVPAILTPEEQSGQTIMSFDAIPQPQTDGSGNPVNIPNVPLVEIRDLNFDGLQNNDAIHMSGGYLPVHNDEFNLKLFNVKIQDAKRGLVVDNKARILADNLDVDHPEQAVSLGSQTESEFYGLKVHDMAGYAAQAVFEVKDSSSVKIEKALFSNLGSGESILNIKTKLAWIYGAEFINNQVAGPVIQLALGKLFKPEENKEHQIGNILIANNDVHGSVIKYQTDDRATFHNIGIHKNTGDLVNIISSSGNTAPSTIINSSITDNNIVSSEVITGADTSGPNAVGVHGTNIYHNSLVSSGENIYGPDNYSIPHCGKSEFGIIYDVTKQILFPDAFDLNTADHEVCALAKGGVVYASWTNNEDGSLGNVGVTGGWKAHLMPDVYQFVTDFYKNTIK